MERSTIYSSKQKSTYPISDREIRKIEIPKVFTKNDDASSIINVPEELSSLPQRKRRGLNMNKHMADHNGKGAVKEIQDADIIEAVAVPPSDDVDVAEEGTSRKPRPKTTKRMSSTIRRIQEKIKKQQLQDGGNLKEGQQHDFHAVAINAVTVVKNARRQRSKSRTKQGKIKCNQLQRPYRRWLGVSTCVAPDTRFIVGPLKTEGRQTAVEKCNNTNKNNDEPHCYSEYPKSSSHTQPNNLSRVEGSEYKKRNSEIVDPNIDSNSFNHPKYCRESQIDQKWIRNDSKSAPAGKKYRTKQCKKHLRFHDSKVSSTSDQNVDNIHNHNDMPFIKHSEESANTSEVVVENAIPSSNYKSNPCPPESKRSLLSKRLVSHSSIKQLSTYYENEQTDLKPFDRRDIICYENGEFMSQPPSTTDKTCPIKGEAESQQTDTTDKTNTENRQAESKPSDKEDGTYFENSKIHSHWPDSKDQTVSLFGRCNAEENCIISQVCYETNENEYLNYEFPLLSEIKGSKGDPIIQQKDSTESLNGLTTMALPSEVDEGEIEQFSMTQQQETTEAKHNPFNSEFQEPDDDSAVCCSSSSKQDTINGLQDLSKPEFPYNTDEAEDETNKSCTLLLQETAQQCSSLRSEFAIQRREEIDYNASEVSHVHGYKLSEPDPLISGPDKEAVSGFSFLAEQEETEKDLITSECFHHTEVDSREGPMTFEFSHQIQEDEIKNDIITSEFSLQAQESITKEDSMKSESIHQIQENDIINEPTTSECFHSTQIDQKNEDSLMSTFSHQIQEDGIENGPMTSDCLNYGDINKELHINHFKDSKIEPEIYLTKTHEVSATDHDGPQLAEVLAVAGKVETIRDPETVPAPSVSIVSSQMNEDPFINYSMLSPNHLDDQGGLAGIVVGEERFDFPSLELEEPSKTFAILPQPIQRRPPAKNSLRQEMRSFRDRQLFEMKSCVRSRTPLKTLARKLRRTQGKAEYINVLAIKDSQGTFPGQLAFKKGQTIKQLDTGLRDVDGMFYGYYRTGKLRRKVWGIYPSTHVSIFFDSDDDDREENNKVQQNH